MHEQDNHDENDQTVTVNRVRAARRTRASTAAVAIAVLTGLGCWAFTFAAERSPQAMQGIFLAGFLGVALLTLEPTSRFQRANWLRILLFYRSPRFYGIVTTAASGLVLVFAIATTPVPRVKARAIIRPKPAPAPAVEPAPVIEPEPVKPPEFPNLEVTGVILGGNRSSALINGRTVLVGEYINDVKLAEVREDVVVVELHGFRKAIQRNIPHSPAVTTPPTHR